jgi:hypothetical protein
MVRCRLILSHADGRVEESDITGEGPIMVGAYFHLPPHAEHWWRVVALRWGGEGGTGVAELEPTELPPELLTLGK